MLRGADPETVRRAIEERDPLPGTNGFAGEVDGALVRDVLGRELCYVDGDDWAHDAAALDDPELLPAGHRSVDGDVRRVWSLPAPVPDEPDDARDGLRDALDGALSVPGEGTAVAFSGGVDSALVASAFPDAALYAVGFPGSADLEAARETADAMGRTDDLRAVTLDNDELATAASRAMDATGRTNAMDVGIAVPLLLASEAAADDGHDRLAVGQGADELFGGYAKVADAADDPRTDADSVRGARDEVLAGLPDQLERDVRAIRGGGTDPVAPLLSDGVVGAALRLPESLLVDGERRKVALREVAADRLPAVAADRDKKAVQYGSLVARELDRLARQDGYKRRIGDHVTKWLRSLD